MKHQIATISTFIVCMCFFISCTDDSNAFVQKIETTQIELKHQDSILIAYRSELSSVAYTNTTKNTNDSLLNSMLQKINPLITRLELMIEKNKMLIEQVKNNSGNSKQVEKDYMAQLDELELMKPEIATTKMDYEKLVAKVNEAFKSFGDITKVK
jgi:protein involved in ribonucleotide reduction